jgi:oligopeptide transport system substrate-binding protein
MSLLKRRVREALPLLLVGLLAAGFTLTGCDDDSTPKSTENGEKSEKSDEDAFKAGSEADMLTFALAADPETFDTASMSGAPEGRSAMQIFEGLLMPGPTTEGIEDSSKLVRPGVAESYEVSDDGKTYTFKIRKDAKWSNGDALTAKDFVFSWRRVLTPSTAADYASLMFLIEGAQGYYNALQKAESEDKEVDADKLWKDVGIKAVDDQTLQVNLINPTPYFPELVAFYTFFPTPQKVIEKHGDDWTKPENIVTNGAYKLGEYEPQKHIIFEKNDQYWDKDNVSIPKAKARIIADRSAVVNAYRAEELHWSGAGLPVSQVSSLVSHPDYRRDPMLGTYYFRVNVSDKDSPLANQKVREALSLAVDRQNLVDNALNGLYKPATSYVPASMAAFESTTETSFSPKKAKDLLKEAGYGKDGKAFPKVALLYNTDENHKLVAEAVQSMWQRYLGIEVELVNKEWKMYLKDVDNLEYEIARAGWIGDYNDPMTFLDMWETGNGNNDTGWSNEKYDGLISQARAETNTEKRTELLQQAEELLLAEGPVIPVYFYTTNALVAGHLEGFEAHNRDIHLLKYMSLPE